MAGGEVVTAPLFQSLPVALDQADAKASPRPCWVEIDHVLFLHDPERPDRLDAFQGHESAVQWPE